ncbi:MAG TPA: Ig-like domain-containing protein [Nitrososphaera sp.]
MSTNEAFAFNVTINNEASCEDPPIDGGWLSITMECLVDSLDLGSGDQVIVPAGVGLANNGIINNNAGGVLVIETGGLIINGNNLNTKINNNAGGTIIINGGTLTNGGIFGGNITNSGSITLTNGGIFDNGITLTNTIINAFGGNITNLNGTISNSFGIMVNSGDINIHCSGIFTGTITSGNALVDACAPVATSQSISTDEDNAVAITLNGTNPDADPDFTGIPLQFLVSSGPSHGNLTGSNATLTYTPDGIFSGTDSFSFVASDGTNNSTEATVTIAVIGINDAPMAVSQNITTDEDTALSITLAGTDVDPGDSLTFFTSAQPKNGTLSGTPPDLIYTPDPNFSGIDSFTFIVKDSSNAISGNTATVSIIVNSVNDLPVANAGADQSVQENVVVTLDGSASSDVETDSTSLTYSWNQTAGPPVTLSDPTSATPEFTSPAVASAETLTFQLVVSDGIADSAPDTVNVTVLATSSGSSNDDDDDDDRS